MKPKLLTQFKGNVYSVFLYYGQKAERDWNTYLFHRTVKVGTTLT